MTTPNLTVLFYVYYLIAAGVALIQSWGELAQIGYVLLFLGLSYMAVYAGLIGPGVAQ